jgi:hypothetical protein
MADIIKVDSLDFTDIRDDLERFLSIPQDIDLSDFQETAIMRQFTNAISHMYNQLRFKIDSVRRESIMDSAVRPESIRYLAMSQLSYNPKRRVAPQHKLGSYAIFKPTENFDPYAILGNITVGDDTYPISLIEDPTPVEIEDENEIKSIRLRGRLCIGSWRTVTITLDPSIGHLSPFFNFRIPEDRDSIDDSKTVKILVNDLRKTSPQEATCVDNLFELHLFRPEEKTRVVLVKNSFFGGLDINFGDGFVFGNILYDGSPESFTVNYLVTPGFIPNLNFNPEEISWDNDYVEEEEIEIPNNEELEIVATYPQVDLDFANGISAEAVESIKTLSPYVAMANQRILTNEDFISRVRRIPNMKSVASMPRHIEPNQVGSVSPLVPTATFQLCGLSIKNVFPWLEEKIYEEDSLVTFEDNVWQRLPNPDLEPIRVQIVGAPPGVYKSVTPHIDLMPKPTESVLWKKLSDLDGLEFQPLTQTEWDLNFFTQYNFDTLLGFMRVRVHSPKLRNPTTLLEEITSFQLQTVLNPFTPGSLTQSQVDQKIRDIILDYCWTLGVFLDIGEIIAKINAITEVQRVFITEPLRNTQLAYDEYIQPKIDLSYEYASTKANRFGR